MPLGAIGAFLGALAVLLGAFGTHVLADLLTPARLETFETAARYHLVHAVLLVVISLAPPRAQAPAGYLVLGGTLVFSGSLYLLALTGFSLLGAVAPIGGLLLVAGWVSLAFKLLAKDEPGGVH